MYNVVYVIPLAVVVLVFSLTLGSRKMTEWQGRVLKLLSGLMMLLLGGVLVLRAELLNNVLVALGLLVISVLLTTIVAMMAKNRHMDIYRDK